MLNADREAASIVSVWLDHGGGSQELQETVNSAIAGTSANTLVAGLVNLSAHLSAMVAALIGSEPQARIGRFIEKGEFDSGPRAGLQAPEAPEPTGGATQD
jgi:hypothetical protein